MAFDRNKFLDRFLQEAKANVARLNEGLLELEDHPDSPEIMDTIFRAAHTIKGSSRLMKYTQISDVAHKLEDALDTIRLGKIRLSKKSLRICLQTLPFSNPKSPAKSLFISCKLVVEFGNRDRHPLGNSTGPTYPRSLLSFLP